MARPGSENAMRNIAWILVATVVLGGGLSFYIYRSIQSEFTATTASPMFMPTAAPLIDPSALQAVADANVAPLDRVILEFATDVREGRVSAAYERMATGYRSTVPLDRFEPAVRANAWLASAQGVQVRRMSFLSGTARVEGILRSGAGNVDLVAQFTDESGTWRMSGLTLGGTPALPGP